MKSIRSVEKIVTGKPTVDGAGVHARRRQRQPDAERHERLAVVPLDRAANVIDDALHDRPRVRLVVHTAKQRGELVATEAGDDVVGSRRLGEA